MPYGYLGTQPNQTIKNTGVLSVTDVNSLIRDGNFGGSLQLIQEYDATSGDYFDFTNLGSYKIHFLDFYDISATGTTELYVRLSNNGGSTFIASGYHYALQFGRSDGYFIGENSTTSTDIRLDCRVDVNRESNGFLYLYDLINPNKYSYGITHNISLDSDASASLRTIYGNYAYPVAETHNALRVFISSSYSLTGAGKIRLFGLQEKKV